LYENDIPIVVMYDEPLSLDHPLYMLASGSIVDTAHLSVFHDVSKSVGINPLTLASISY
jgi:hypothetical protein